MPPDKWNQKHFDRKAQKAEKQWGNTHILPVGPEVDATARYLIEKDRKDDPPPDHDKGRRR